MSSTMIQTIASPGWTEPYSVLRNKWHEVPCGEVRRSTTELVLLPDEELLSLWEEADRFMCEGSLKGWMYALYADAFRGKRILDVGSGMGHDAVHFARSGAAVTCLDIVESNLEVVRRVAGLNGVAISTFWMEDIAALHNLEGPYDVLWCSGSLVTLPFDIAREECQQLLRHLKRDGRWIELALPRVRWEREGELPFEEWGKHTDGETTPWMEWYDLPKLKRRLAPSRFETILSFEFHSSDFNWFDLRRLA